MDVAAEIMANSLVKDSLFLSSHEFYDSSRLGMKQYGGPEEFRFNYYNQAVSSSILGYLGGAKQAWWWPSTGALMGPLGSNPTQARRYDFANQNNAWLKLRVRSITS